MAYTDRVVGGDYNRVADVDGRIVFGERLQRRRSSTRRATTRRAASFANAPLWDGILGAQRQAVRIPLYA